MQSEVLDWEREQPPLTQAWEGQVERIWFEDDAALYNLETPTCPISDENLYSIHGKTSLARLCTDAGEHKHGSSKRCSS